MDNEAFEDDEELSDEEAKAKLTKKRGKCFELFFSNLDESSNYHYFHTRLYQ